MIELIFKDEDQTYSYQGKNYEHLWLQLEDASQHIIHLKNNEYNEALAKTLDKPVANLTMEDQIQNDLTEEQIKQLIIDTLPKYGFHHVSMSKES